MKPIQQMTLLELSQALSHEISEARGARIAHLRAKLHAWGLAFGYPVQPKYLTEKDMLEICQGLSVEYYVKVAKPADTIVDVVSVVSTAITDYFRMMVQKDNLLPQLPFFEHIQFLDDEVIISLSDDGNIKEHAIGWDNFYSVYAFFDPQSGESLLEWLPDGVELEHCEQEPYKSLVRAKVAEVLQVD